MSEKRARPTIHDVARRAGVSATTVSHTFSGKGVVAAATRERVREAARELGYRPDALAQGLRNSRLGVIGLVLRPLETLDTVAPAGVDYFLRFAGSAAIAAMELGYGLMLIPDPTRESSPAAASACDGFLVTEPVADDPLLAMLHGERIPFLAVGRDPNVAYEAAVDTDTLELTDLVLDHLEQCGATRIAVVAGTDRNSWNADTEAAYLAWCSKHGQAPLLLRQPEADGEAAGRLAADELLDTVAAPDAVYCLTGRHAAGLLARACELGVGVPEQLQIVAGSDSEHSRAAMPPITSVDLQPELLARVAVAKLVGVLDGSEAPPVDSPGRLIVRASTRAAIQPAVVVAEIAD